MSDISEGNVQERIQKTVFRALGISKPDATIPLRLGSTPGWDSMGHMVVVMELEKEFGVRFGAYELPSLIDVPCIERTLSEGKFESATD